MMYYKHMVNQERIPTVHAAAIDTILNLLHIELCRMMPEVREKFWKVPLRERLIDYARMKGLNGDIL